jgi:hypothetical protein
VQTPNDFRPSFLRLSVSLVDFNDAWNDRGRTIPAQEDSEALAKGLGLFTFRVSQSLTLAQEFPHGSNSILILSNRARSMSVSGSCAEWAALLDDGFTDCIDGKNENLLGYSSAAGGYPESGHRKKSRKHSERAGLSMT